MRPLRLGIAVFLVATASNSATFLIAPDRELVQATPAIVLVTAGPSHAQRAPGGWIETVTTMHVDESIKGAIDDGATIEVTELGGFLDGVGYVVAGSPAYAPGERMLLFLQTNSRGDWVAKNMAVGKFAFRSDVKGRRLLLRDARELCGWDTDGTPHREPTRDAERFLHFVRETARGVDAPVDYLVDGGQAPRLSGTAEAAVLQVAPDAATINSYLLQSTGGSGTLGIRWNVFPTGVVFLSHGSQPGANGGGVPSIQAGLAAWTNDPGSNVVYQYGGTTTIAQTGFKSGSPDGVNTIQFNDPADEIPGAFTNQGGATLAIGGGWFGNATHTFHGETFYTIQEADLVVQNGITGAGLTGPGFDHVVTHELGHTLGLRHSNEPPPGGTSTTAAIMNASVNFNNDFIGSTLQAWDQEAIDAVYGAGTTPPPPPCTPPTITAQPQSVNLGSSSVLLTVSATGDSPLTYQWYIGTSGNTTQPIAGAVVAAVNVQPAVTTSYWVRVSNGCTPPADSNTAVVTVNGCPAVTITSITSSDTIVEGTAVALAGNATGGTVSYQWFIGTSGDTSQPVAGGNRASINVQPTATTSYWLRASNTCGASNNSDTITITVLPCTAARAVVQPAGGNVVNGTSATLFFGVAGTPPLRYQWYEGTTGNTSKPVAGATSETLVTPQLTAGTSFWARVTNDCGTVDSATAPLVIVATCTTPVITKQPQSGGVSSGSTATLTVAVSGASLTYQWYQGQVFDFTHPLGGSAPTLVTPAITAPADFWVRITSPCGSVNSGAATLTPLVSPRRRGARH